MSLRQLSMFLKVARYGGGMLYLDYLEMNKHLFNRQLGICWLCDQPMELDNTTRDHIVPVSKGGDWNEKNIRLAHPLCNSLRGNLHAAVSPEYVKRCLAGNMAAVHWVKKSATKVKVNLPGRNDARRWLQQLMDRPGNSAPAGDS